MTCHAAILFALVYAGSALAHGGGLDNSDGRTNRNTSEYHCHHEPCVAQHEKAKSAVSAVVCGICPTREQPWLTHGHGGDRLTDDRKRMFANDPGNLLATSASADRSKGAKGPDQWLPSFGHCEYVVSAHSSGYLPESACVN
jgi:hypothetical protein